MRSGELQTGKKRGKPSENATNDALWEPPGSSGTFRVIRVEAYGISVARIFFFLSPESGKACPENNRRFHVFDGRASGFHENRGRVDRVARRSRNRNARRHR